MNSCDEKVPLSMSSLYSVSILSLFWAADVPPGAPPEIQALIRAAAVSIDYSSEPEFEQQDEGRCTFRLEFTRKFQYRYQKSKRRGHSVLTVKMTSIDPSVTVTNVIQMPARYIEPNPWQNQLLRHEFDHVAISIDPRPKLLLTYLVQRLPPIEHRLETGSVPDDELFSRLINAELDRREDAVSEVIRRNNDLLDEVSRHGTIAVPNRGEFFAGLYTKDHLASLEFPFVADALKLFETPDYIAAELLHLERDPTDKGTKTAEPESN